MALIESVVPKFSLRTRRAFSFFPGAAAVLGFAFFLKQNGLVGSPALGGAISASKTVWLLYALTLWFFLTPTLAMEAAVPAPLRRTFQVFSLWMWFRGILELILLYGPKLWSPIIGITHDLSCFLILVLGPWFFRSEYVGDLARRAWGSRSGRIPLLFLALLVTSLLVEMHHAWSFYEVVAGRTTGDTGVWFATEQESRFQAILLRTQLFNFPLLGALLYLIFEVRRAVAPSTRSTSPTQESSHD